MTHAFAVRSYEGSKRFMVFLAMVLSVGAAVLHPSSARAQQPAPEPASMNAPAAGPASAPALGIRILGLGFILLLLGVGLRRRTLKPMPRRTAGGVTIGCAPQLPPSRSACKRSGVTRRAGRASLLFLAPLFVGLVLTSSAQAEPPPVLLGTANAFAVLGGSTITNTGNSVINGDLGLHPGTAVTGFPPGTVNGSKHITDAVALQAKADLTTAYNDAAGRPRSATSPPDIGGQRLTAGVYRTGSVPALELTGNVTLDAQGDPRAVFIFQAESTLVTATDSSVTLINGAQACNVYWQVGSSATLGTRTAFKGTVMALSSISVNDAVRIEGRLFARNGAVTLINDTINRPQCAAGTGGETAGGGDAGGGETGGGTATGGTGAGGTGGGSTTTTPGGTAAGAPSGGTGGAAPAGGTEAGDGRTTTTGGGAEAGRTSAGPDRGGDTGGGDTGGGTGGGDTSGGTATGDGASADEALGATIPFTGLDIRFLGLGLVLILLGIGLRAGLWGHGTKT